MRNHAITHNLHRVTGKQYTKDKAIKSTIDLSESQRPKTDGGKVVAKLHPRQYDGALTPEFAFARCGRAPRWRYLASRVRMAHAAVSSPSL